MFLNTPVKKYLCNWKEVKLILLLHRRAMSVHKHPKVQFISQNEIAACPASQNN